MEIVMDKVEYQESYLGAQRSMTVNSRVTCNGSIDWCQEPIHGRSVILT